MRSRAPTTPQPAPKPTLRLACLAALRHPYSIDLYLERVCARARLVRRARARRRGLLALRRRRTGGAGAPQRRQARACAGRPARRRAPRRGLDARRATRFSGSGAISTRAAPPTWRRASRFFARRARRRGARPAARAGQRLRPLRGRVLRWPRRARRRRSSSSTARSISPAISRRSRRWPGRSATKASRPRASMSRASRTRPRSRRSALLIESRSFDVVLNATAFSARLDEGEGTVLDALDAPVLQVVLAGVGLEAWRASLARPRAGRPCDACRAAGDRRADPHPRHLLQGARPRDASTEFAAVAHQPLADRVAFVAELARRWASLRRNGAGGEAPRLRIAGLSGARRTHRLCGRARHARERGRHRRNSARRRIRRRPRLRRAGADRRARRKGRSSRR